MRQVYFPLDGGHTPPRKPSVIHCVRHPGVGETCCGLSLFGDEIDANAAAGHTKTMSLCETCNNIMFAEVKHSLREAGLL